MKRRENRLPEWTRTIWTSEVARTTWEPRIQQISALTSELELRTVAEGVRRAAWIFVTPEHLGDMTVELAGRGLLLVPLSRSGVLGSYASSGLPYQKGQPFNYRAIVVRQEDGVGELSKAFLVGENEAIGRALGYPECCRDFFERVWVREKWLDTTWPMASADDSEVKTLRFDVVDRWPANILGRWAGVRAVPWLPCSFTCKGTVETWLEGWESLARDIDAQALEWLQTLLCASWRWSALHGIAEIETSVFKVSTRTDTCDEVHVVEYAGAQLEAGASGTRFPFHVPTDPQLTKGKSFATGLKALSIQTLTATANLWVQNGFSSREAMERAHDVLLEALEEGYDFVELANQQSYVMDPNCGNGTFLEILAEHYPGLVGCGIECIRERAIAAYERLPPIDEERIVFGSLALLDNWRGREYDLVLMMPGRLLELEAVERAGVLYYLKMHARRLLVYAYDAKDHKDLEGYARRAGLLEHWHADFQVVTPGVAAAAVCCPIEAQA